MPRPASRRTRGCMASRARRSTTTRCVTVRSSASRRACRSSTHTPSASASFSSSGAPSWRARSPGAALARRFTSRSPWAPCFRLAIWSTAPPCSKPGATRVSSSRSAGCSRPSAAPRSSASSASPSPSPRPGARRDHSRLLAASARPGAPDRGGPDRVRRGRWRLDGTLQARVDAVGPAGDARAPGDARARRRARRGRARARRGAREVRRRPAPLPPARGRDGARDRRHDHRRRDSGEFAGLPPAHHRPSHRRWSRLSSRLPALERADSLLRAREGKDDRRMARVDPVRRRDDRRPLVARRSRRAEALAPLSPSGALLLVLAAVAPAFAHHVGAYVPTDNEITTNFKQIKFSVQAGKFDVALRFFETGPLRADMRARAGSLPRGLEAGLSAALAAGDAAEVERRLMVFFAALARDLALDAERRTADPQLSHDARAAIGARFLEAIWRYYNL